MSDIADKPDVDESKPQDESPAGWQRHWAHEFEAAKKAIQPFHSDGDKVVRKFLAETEQGEEKGLNLFPANVQTERAILYGNMPRVDVGRKFSDAGDDEARVAGEILERCLNCDIIEEDSEGFSDAAGLCLEDYQLPGLAMMRHRYVAEFETVPEVPAQTDPMTGMELAPVVPEHEKKVSERIESDYVHWKDQLWSPCRVRRELRWWAFKAQMTRQELRERFGEVLGEVVEQVPLNGRTGITSADGIDGQKEDPRSRAEVWEIHSKEHRKVFWYVEVFTRILEVKDDFLGLRAFWPFGPPLMANTTTSKLMPKPDYSYAEELYKEADMLHARIRALEQEVRVRGAYDKTAGREMEQLLSKTGGNKLIPSENWGALSEKGGIPGVISWLPLDMVTGALHVMEGRLMSTKQMLFEVTGFSDIVRGQASGPATATEQSIKAKFASVRLTHRQNVFAKFVSDAQRVRAEIMCLHFDAETLIQKSNILKTPDAKHAQAAVQLLKSRFWDYRVEVKPESVSLTDYAALQQERGELMTTLSGFLKNAAPLGQAQPEMAPALLELLQWMVSGLKGSAGIEAVLDDTVTKLKQAAAQPKEQKPDPKLQATQMKVQGDMQRDRMKLQGDMQLLQAETQSEMAKRQQDAQLNLMESEAQQRQQGVAAVSGLIPGRGP